MLLTTAVFAIDGDTIYGVGQNLDIWKQPLSKMDAKTPWILTAKGSVTSIAISGDTIYGVGVDHQVYKQTLSTMNQSAANIA